MKKVVIIDDKKAIAKLLQVYLSDTFDVSYFENPLEFLAAIKEGFRPDLIISDIKMPKMDGVELLNYVKENEILKHIPFVVLSGEDSSLQKVSLLERGAADYLSKPFNPAELKIRLKKLLT